MSLRPSLDDLASFIRDNDYVCAYLMPDDRVAFVTATTFGAQIGISTGVAWSDGVSERYSYGTVAFATVHLGLWSRRGFEGEPDGWVRHVPSNRRRVDGDPTLEEVRP